MTHRLSRLAAAVLVTAAAGLTVLGISSPASAATCSTASGVSVIVDFKQLGGGIQGTCVAGGGGQRASSLFPTAGFPIDYVQSQPGFVCRVSGLPTASDEPCVDTPPATAYWGLWWSDGKTGTWTFSSYGVSSLKIPDGGYVALAWKKGDAAAPPPGVAAAPHQAASPTPSASPTRTPSPSPTRTPTGNPTPTSTTGPTSSASVTPSPSDSLTGSPTGLTSGSASESPTESVVPTESPTASASPSASPSASASGQVVAEPAAPVDAEASDGSDDGLPIALVLVVIAALFGAAGVVVVRRRRT